MRLINVVLTLLLLGPARAGALPDDELGRALKTLKSHVHVVDHSPLHNLVTAGGWLSLNGLRFAGVLALPMAVQKKTMRSSQRLFVRLALAAVNVGGVMWLIGWTGQRTGGKPRVADLPARSSASFLNEFFKLDVENQYAFARSDAPFASFLIDLADAYNRIDRGYSMAAGPDPAASSAAKK